MNRGLAQGILLPEGRLPQMGRFSQSEDIGDDCTIVGWSSYTQKLITAKNFGILTLLTYNVSGTSNSTSTSIVLPAAYNNLFVYVERSLGVAMNNGTLNANGGMVSLSGNTISFGLTHANSAWTGSGTKTIQGQIVVFRRYI